MQAVRVSSQHARSQLQFPHVSLKPGILPASKRVSFGQQSSGRLHGFPEPTQPAHTIAEQK